MSDKKLSTLDILRDKAGTRRDFVKIFTELCHCLYFEQFSSVISKDSKVMA